MYLFLDQVRWFFKLVAQCKVWLATSVAHLVKPAILKHHATKQQIICLSSVSSVKLDVPFSWPSVVVLQVGSTVQTMIGHPCGTSCEASEFETSCNKATNHLFIKRFKRQAWCYFFLDQVWWFFKLVAQCKLWLATTVAHLVKPATLKHHATKQDVIFLSSVSSVKLNVTFFLTKCGGSSSW